MMHRHGEHMLSTSCTNACLVIAENNKKAEHECVAPPNSHEATHLAYMSLVKS